MDFVKKKNIVCQYYSMQRSFITPTPNERVMLDSISSFLNGVTRSLRVGTVRNTKFTVEFRTDVFRLLFGGKGERANNGRGRASVSADGLRLQVLFSWLAPMLG